MSIAKITEVISSSPSSFEEAIANGIERANKTIKGIQGAWVKDQQVLVDNGKVTEYRVTIKITFIIND
ncbi:MAG: dodecin family protein [Pseudomonadota bacterium]